MVPIEPNEEKFAELLLYVAREIEEDPTGGATKINKILFFAEFSHMRTHGKPITGMPYQKLPQGPAPRRLLPVRGRLIEEGSAELRMDDYFGFPLSRLVALREVQVAMFGESERRAVDQVIGALWGKTAKEVSDLSHEEMGWKMVEDGEDIPFSSAFLARRVVVTDKMRKRAEDLAEKLGITG
jgi:hypothetical protein